MSMILKGNERCVYCGLVAEVRDIEAKKITEKRIRWPFNYYSLQEFSEDVFEQLFD